MKTLLNLRPWLSLAFVVGATSATSTFAEETGSGHYAPGAMASFVDTLPGRPTLAVADYFMYYDASASANRPIAFGGLVTLDAHAQAYVDSILALYESPLKLFGGDYGLGLAIPYVWLEVDGNVAATVNTPDGPIRGTVRMRDTANGIGDLTLYPFMLGWKKGEENRNEKIRA